MNHHYWLSFVVGFVGIAPAYGQDRAGVAFFEAKIRPALVAHCYKCHSEESGKSRGGLRVDTRDALLRGGDTGPAIVRGNPRKSLLYLAMTHTNDDLQMPPKGKLPDATVADFRKWIDLGAPDPRTTKIGPTVQTKIDLVAGRKYWAYRPPAKPELPTVRQADWALSDIDRFTLSKLETKGLTAAKDAKARVLIRRLFFVLNGLPPTPEEMEQWEKKIGDGEQRDHEAVGTLVDELLRSPRFGVRWGRHWMDVARFAESTGGDSNNIQPHAWRYRDYVIDSFNADKPFDQFVREQIAGDLLPIANDREWADNVVATGFLAIGVKRVGEEDQPKFFADLVDEQIDATTRAFLATTVACARCHDHKFDPIPQSDYYAMAGIFRSTATHFGGIQAQARQATTLLDLTGFGLDPNREKLTARELSSLRQARDDAAQKMIDIMRDIRAGINVPRSVLRRSRTARDRTQAALKAYDELGKPRVFAMGTQDKEYPLPTRLLVRGELDKPAQLVPRGVLQVATSPDRHTLSRTTRGSGRLQLAHWIGSDDNPLTARVIANRVWHWLFGQGIVRTVDDFGRTGEAPSHPALLDHLALRLIEHEWSVKELIREIVLTRTWQLSSDFDAKNFAVDPDNRWLWRANKRRLEAEAIRDVMLSVSGQLDEKRPVGTLLTKVGEGSVGLAVFEPEIRKLDWNHRSVYLPRVRGVLPRVMELFDAPDASLVLGARETTTNPLQALYLMNDPWVQTQSEHVARRVEKRPAAEHLEYAHQLAFGRTPTPSELGHAKLFRERCLKLAAKANLTEEQAAHHVLTAYCQSLLCAAEFRIID